MEQIAHGKCNCRTVILTMIFHRLLVPESSITGLGVHTRWWMYDNITLHSLCYLARLWPVPPTAKQLLAFAKHYTILCDKIMQEKQNPLAVG